MTYRNGNRNARNIYRVGPDGEQHIGCAFTEDDGRLIVLALRFAAQDLATMPPHPTCLDVSTLGQRHGTTWVCGNDCPRHGIDRVLHEPTPRIRACVEAWPDCASGDYDPRCCRFPKSCSCTAYDPDQVTAEYLEDQP